MSAHQHDAVMRRHIIQWQGSGLSQRAYCQEHNIKVHKFSYYKKKLWSDVKTDVTSQLIPVQISADLSTPPLTLADEINTVQLSHSNGFSLQVDSRTNLAPLKPLLELVRSVA